MEPGRADSLRRQNRLACITLTVLWVIVLMVIVWANLNGRWGSGMRLAATAGLLFIGGFVTLFWFVLFAPLRRRIRWGTFAALIVVCMTLVAMFRLEEVSGGLRPRFVFRWSPHADQRLDDLRPMSSDSAAEIDLQTVSENDYPRFLGPDLTQSIDGVRFDTNWSETPPHCVWRQPIGAGWSSFVSINGYAITQEQRGDQESVTCYEITSGRLVWINSVTTRHETRLGGVGPRSTPCVDEGRVYALGATGIFRCLDGSTGGELWRHDLLDITHVENDEQEIAWGRAGSPLIVDQTVVVPVGGPQGGQKSSLIAFDKRTGLEVWRAGNRQISYASPTRAKLLGTDQIVIVLEDCVSSFDVHSQQLLWEYPWPGRSDTNANVSNAVPLTDNHVFLSKGYGQGAELLQLRVDTMGHWNVNSVWKQPVMLKTKFSNIVAYDGHIYGLNDVILECVEITTGRRCWKRGRFGYGQLMRAGRILILLSEDGELAAVEATPERFIERGRFTALDGKCWSHLCVYGPYLLVRNATEAACYALPNWRRDPSPRIDANSSVP